MMKKYSVYFLIVGFSLGFISCEGDAKIEQTNKIADFDDGYPSEINLAEEKQLSKLYFDKELFGHSIPRNAENAEIFNYLDSLKNYLLANLDLKYQLDLDYKIEILKDLELANKPNYNILAFDHALIPLKRLKLAENENQLISLLAVEILRLDRRILIDLYKQNGFAIQSLHEVMESLNANNEKPASEKYEYLENLFVKQHQEWVSKLADIDSEILGQFASSSFNYTISGLSSVLEIEANQAPSDKVLSSRISNIKREMRKKSVVVDKETSQFKTENFIKFKEAIDAL